MTLTPEEVIELKAQLSQQIQHLPEPQKSQAQQQINDMSPQALEELLKQQQERNDSGPKKTIFRMIVDKDVDAVKVEENEEAIAVLELNPISNGHALILPKEAVTAEKTLPTGAFDLAKKLSEKITQRLGAKSVEIQTESKFGEKIINLIPIYDAPLTLNSPRKKSSKEELEAIAKKFEPEEKKEVIKITTQPNPQSEVVKLRRRIA